jgi:outer membrane protein
MKKIILMLMLFAPLSMFAQQKFGHVDSQAIMQSMPEFIKAKGEVDALQKQKENDLKAMQDELQRKSDEYDKTKSTMNATKQQETETELQQMYQKIQQAVQLKVSKIFRKASQEKMQPVSTKLVNAIKNVGKAGGYVYIMDVASGIPYISETLSKDVTNEVKAELNKIK